jgi:cell wall-associated NlpC family hydrolase
MPPMRAEVTRRRRFRLTLIAACLFAISTAGLAQNADERSFGAAAAATMKDAAASAYRSAQDLTSAALNLIGIRYKWGGNTPETGLDCSGLVRYVFQQVTGVTLPRTAKDMSQLGERIAIADLQPGDLVFFNTRRFAFSHVGIYLGDNRFVHAPRRGRDVEVAEFDSGFWQKRFSGARRLVGVLPSMIPSIISEAAAAPLDEIGPLDRIAPLDQTSPLDRASPLDRNFPLGPIASQADPGP